MDEGGKMLADIQSGWTLCWTAADGSYNQQRFVSRDALWKKMTHLRCEAVVRDDQGIVRGKIENIQWGDHEDRRRKWARWLD